ncbi:MAG: hypothetical protein MZV64_10320 [Ignavibacteriales bacterium]|nr:hypothetical protein [Ignavibacteriales bacterium]
MAVGRALGFVHRHGMGWAQIRQPFLGFEVIPPGSTHGVLVDRLCGFQRQRPIPELGQVPARPASIVRNEQLMASTAHVADLESVAGQLRVRQGVGLSALDGHARLIRQDHLLVLHHSLVDDQGLARQVFPARGVRAEQERTHVGVEIVHPCIGPGDKSRVVGIGAVVAPRETLADQPGEGLAVKSVDRRSARANDWVGRAIEDGAKGAGQTDDRVVGGLPVNGAQMQRWSDYEDRRHTLALADRRELVGIANEQELQIQLLGVCRQPLEEGAVDHRGFIDDDQTAALGQRRRATLQARFTGVVVVDRAQAEELVHRHGLAAGQG